MFAAASSVRTPATDNTRVTTVSPGVAAGVSSDEAKCGPFAAVQTAAALAAGVPAGGVSLRLTGPDTGAFGGACPGCSDPIPTPRSGAAPAFHHDEPVRNRNGVVVGALCVHDDVPHALSTERFEMLRLLADQAGVVAELMADLGASRAELAAKAPPPGHDADSMYRHLVDCLPEIYFLVTPDGSIKDMSASGREVMGTALGGEGAPEGLGALHEEDREIFASAYRRVFVGGRAENAIIRVRSDNHTYRHFDVLIAPRPYPETGPPTEAFIVCRDITERVSEAAALAERTEQLAQSEERFRQALLHSGVGIALTDMEGNWAEFNEALASMLGYTREEFGQLRFVDLIPNGDFPLHRDALASLLAGKEALLSADFRYVHKSGRELWFSTTSSVIRAADGTPLHLATHVDDVTHRRAALEEVSAERDRSAALLSTVRDAFAYAVNGRIEDVNAAMSQLTGLRRDELIGQRAPFSFWPEEMRDPEVARLRKDTAERRGEVEMQWIRPDGSRIDVSLYTCPVDDAGSGLPGLVAIARDVTEARRQERRLRHLAEHDGLTGLLNQTAFSAILQQHLAGAQASDDRLSLVLLDLDNFKSVNDTYGHLSGDAVLVEFAARLRRAARTSDVVGRVGGEEFAWLMPRTPLDEAVSAVERAARQMRTNAFPQVGIVTFSAGVSEWDPAGSAASEWSDVARDLRHRADVGLYAAKRNGRDRVMAPPSRPR
jgi:diguanylate cyclase (GGDEF)-like protein/PAS domain S-box-containing protein